jgi:hypothetical protein
MELGHKGHLPLVENLHSPDDPGFKYLCETESTCNEQKISVTCGSVIGRFHCNCNLDSPERVINIS